MSVFYTGNMLASSFSGLIAAGVFHGMDGAAGLAGWQWLFVLQGTVTLVIATIGFFFLPDYPLTTRWLNADERNLAHTRMEMDTVGNEGETSLLGGLREAAQDPLVWVRAPRYYGYCFPVLTHNRRSSRSWRTYILLRTASRT